MAAVKHSLCVNLPFIHIARYGPAMPSSGTQVAMSAAVESDIPKRLTKSCGIHCMTASFSAPLNTAATATAGSPVAMNTAGVSPRVLRPGAAARFLRSSAAFSSILAIYPERLPSPASHTTPQAAMSAPVM